MFRQYNWIVIKMPYRVDRLGLAAGGGEIGKYLLRKEMGVRTWVPCVLCDLTQPIWVSYGLTADGERVYTTVPPLLPDLNQYF